MLTIKRLLRGARFVVFASVAIAGCGGGDGGGGGEGDDDSGKGGSGDAAGEGGTSGTSGTAGSDNGGTDTGGSGGTDTGGKGGTSGKGGTGGKGGTSGTGTGATGPALDRIEAACDVDCDGQFALECAPTTSNTLVCKANCAAQTAQLGDFCLAEYAQYVECRGEGGYECVSDRPTQLAACSSEQVEFSMCMQNIGCKRSCDKSVDEACTSMSLDECIEECIGVGATLPTSCSYYWDSVASCKWQGGTCVDGALTTPETCASTVMRIAECIYDDDDVNMDMCAAWCWAADELGCGGADCAAECASRVADATCGAAWNEVLDCGLFFGDAGCADGYLAANSICDSEMTAYTTCVTGAGM